MDVLDCIEARRSIKFFTDREVTREEIERLLETVVVALNHRMTDARAWTRRNTVRRGAVWDQTGEFLE